MKRTCPLCSAKIDGDLVEFLEHGQEHVMEEIKKKHPHWVRDDGLCPKCLEYFQKQIKG